MEKCLFSPTVGRFWGYHFIPDERPHKPSWLRFDCFGRLSHTGNVLAAEAKVDAFPCDLSTPFFFLSLFICYSQLTLLRHGGLLGNRCVLWHGTVLFFKRCKRCRGCSMSHNSKCFSLQICARIPTVLWFPILFQHYVSKLSTQATTNADSSETEPNRKRKRDSRGTLVDLTSVDPKHRKRLEKVGNIGPRNEHPSRYLKNILMTGHCRTCFFPVWGRGSILRLEPCYARIRHRLRPLMQ
eukprot:g13035.t1